MSHLTTDLFNSLYRKHYEQLFYYAYGFTDDAEVCRDILADVFESLWTHRKKITQETAHSYLYQCVRNKCIDYVRRQQLNRQYESFIKGTADTDTDMETRRNRGTDANGTGMHRPVASQNKTRFGRMLLSQQEI